MEYSCVDECPKGYYSNGNECLKCSQGCVSCSAGLCTECEQDLYKLDGNCLASCP